MALTLLRITTTSSDVNPEAVWTLLLTPVAVWAVAGSVLTTSGAAARVVTRRRPVVG